MVSQRSQCGLLLGPGLIKSFLAGSSKGIVFCSLLCLPQPPASASQTLQSASSPVSVFQDPDKTDCRGQSTNNKSKYFDLELYKHVLSLFNFWFLLLRPVASTYLTLTTCLFMTSLANLWTIISKIYIFFAQLFSIFYDFWILFILAPPLILARPLMFSRCCRCKTIPELTEN